MNKFRSALTLAFLRRRNVVSPKNMKPLPDGCQPGNTSRKTTGSPLWLAILKTRYLRRFTGK